MNDSQDLPGPDLSFPWYLRMTLIAVGGGMLALLITAATLQPSGDGFGTHRQLGLPRCSFVQWSNGKLKCPSCGMTTSWANMTRGYVWPAVQANIGGAILAVIALTVGVWTVLSGMLGRWATRPPGELVAAIAGTILLCIILSDWVLRNFLM